LGWGGSEYLDVVGDESNNFVIGILEAVTWVVEKVKEMRS
jgi:hypothetical protein